MTPVRLEVRTLGLESSTLPLSHCAPISGGMMLHLICSTEKFLSTGVCSYVQKHVIDALKGFSQFLANEVSKVRNIVFVIVFIFGFTNCNVVLLDANTANFGSTSLALTASIFTLSTYIGIVIVNSVLCRKNP